MCSTDISPISSFRFLAFTSSNRKLDHQKSFPGVIPASQDLCLMLPGNTFLFQEVISAVLNSGDLFVLLLPPSIQCGKSTGHTTQKELSCKEYTLHVNQYLRDVSTWSLHYQNNWTVPSQPLYPIPRGCKEKKRRKTTTTKKQQPRNKLTNKTITKKKTQTIAAKLNV